MSYTRFRLTANECFGSEQDDYEEVCWGPYDHGIIETFKAFETVEPADFMLDGYTPENIVYGEDYLMWDIYQRRDDHEYTRFGYYAVVA